MRLERLRIQKLGPFGEVELHFLGADGEARPVTVIYGDGGTGKSTVHSAIENTRPGHVTKGQLFRNAPKDASIACAWRLDEEDPERPHPLWIGSPGFAVHEDEAQERLRRSEQSFSSSPSIVSFPGRGSA
jgi:DNA repair ATPase RecN